jgi:single-stranded-DNA-specific exonuclease
MDENLFQATLWTDGELTDATLHLETLDWIDRLGPWGQKFPISFGGRFKVMDYRWLKDQHLKLKVSLGQQIIDAIAFNAMDRFEFNPMLGYVDLVYTLERNVFNGNTSLQLQISFINKNPHPQ